MLTVIVNIGLVLVCGVGILCGVVLAVGFWNGI